MYNIIDEPPETSYSIGESAVPVMRDAKGPNADVHAIAGRSVNAHASRATRSGRQAAVRAVSVVIPAYNEAANLPLLIAETDQALSALDIDFEIVVVDDASVDGTDAVLQGLTSRFPRLVALRAPRNQGQSAAICRGVLAARCEWIATLDGDGQNVPGDLVRLVHSLESASLPDRVGMLAGERVKRNDTLLKRISSRVANAVRARVLGDGIRDTGCGIKLFRRSLFLNFPYFDHMHRFLPALVRMHGMDVISTPVRHRARQHGESKYGLLDRLICGIPDLIGVAWLRRRALTDLDPARRTLEP